VQRIKDIIILVLERLVGILLILMSAVTLAQVFCRYALGFSLPWSHELVILAMIWAVWLSIPIGMDRMEHLSVTFLLSHRSTIRGFRLTWVHFSLAIVFFSLVFILSFPVVEAFEGMALLSIPVPINARYYAAMVGSLTTVFVLAAKIVVLIRER
jgi:TRAP-type transport system small permease protein